MKNAIPEWFLRNSVYQINPRTFSKEGTINSIIPELPFLKGLGFNIIYLCPIFETDDSTDLSFWSERQKKYKTNNPKNPYRMNNYFNIDSEYGTIDDLKKLVTCAHELDMRVIFDLVYLHIGPNADILKNHPEFAKRNEDGIAQLTIWNFPFLNYESEGLREYLYSNMAYYIGEIDVDGFRCDVGDDVPLAFWAEGYRRIKAIKPDCIMINEGRKPEYFSVFDANYGFSWHESIFSLLTKKITLPEFISKYKLVLASTPNGKVIIRDMDNHDTVTDWPYRIEKHFGQDCMEFIQALNFTIDGVPMVYCGNELADTARVNMFANRFFMGEYEVTDRTKKYTEESLRRQFVYKTLHKMRKENDAVCYGDIKLLETSTPNNIISFEREFNGEKIVFVGNFSENNSECVLDNLISKNKIILENNIEICNNKITMDAYGYAIAKI